MAGRKRQAPQPAAAPRVCRRARPCSWRARAYSPTLTSRLEARLRGAGCRPAEGRQRRQHIRRAAPPAPLGKMPPSACPGPPPPPPPPLFFFFFFFFFFWSLRHWRSEEEGSAACEPSRPLGADHRWSSLGVDACKRGPPEAGLLQTWRGGGGAHPTPSSGMSRSGRADGISQIILGVEVRVQLYARCNGRLGERRRFKADHPWSARWRSDQPRRTNRAKLEPRQRRRRSWRKKSLSLSVTLSLSLSVPLPFILSQAMVSTSPPSLTRETVPRATPPARGARARARARPPRPAPSARWRASSRCILRPLIDRRRVVQPSH